MSFGENPKLGTKLAKGRLGTEQLDALAEASTKSGGDAATDKSLINEIENAPVDQASKITRKWLERREEDGAQTRFDRQNARRGVQNGYDQINQCDTLTIRGPQERIDENSRAPSAVHPRSMIDINITVDPDEEQLIRAECPNGDGYLPETVLDKYGCGSIIAGSVFNAKGEVIWFGRTRRYATPAQFAALVARDRGCVLCGRDPSRCEAHHIQPFNSSNKGTTDVEGMALRKRRLRLGSRNFSGF